MDEPLASGSIQPGFDIAMNRAAQDLIAEGVMYSASSSDGYLQAGFEPLPQITIDANNISEIASRALLPFPGRSGVSISSKYHDAAAEHSRSWLQRFTPGSKSLSNLSTAGKVTVAAAGTAIFLAALPVEGLIAAGAGIGAVGMGAYELAIGALDASSAAELGASFSELSALNQGVSHAISRVGLLARNPQVAAAGAAIGERLSRAGSRIREGFDSALESGGQTLSKVSLWRSSEEPSLFFNKFSEHVIERADLFSASEIQHARYSGELNYVVLKNRNLVMGKDGYLPGGGHIDLASGEPVLAAGEVKFVNGKVRYIDNTSGHYQPSGVGAKQIAEEIFTSFGFDAKGKYIEKYWHENLALRRGGQWKIAP